MSPTIFVEHRARRIVACAAGAVHEIRGRLADLFRVDLVGAHLGEHFEAALDQPSAGQPVMLRNIQMDARHRQPPLVADSGSSDDERAIVGNEIVKHLEIDREVVVEVFAAGAARDGCPRAGPDPLRLRASPRRSELAAGNPNRINAALGQVGNAWRQEVVIGDRALEEGVAMPQRLVRMVLVVKPRAAVREAVELKMASDEAGTVGEAIGKLARPRQQEEPRAFRPPSSRRTRSSRARRARRLPSPGRCTRSPRPRSIDRDFPHHGVGPQLAVARRERSRHVGFLDARLGARPAAESRAAPAIGAGRTTAIRARGNRPRRRETDASRAAGAPARGARSADECRQAAVDTAPTAGLRKGWCRRRPRRRSPTPPACSSGSSSS